MNIECLLQIFRVAILTVVWSEKGLTYLEERACVQIAMSVIIYLLTGNQQVVIDMWGHIKTGMRRFMAYIAEGIEQIMKESRALGGLVIGTMLFGNFCAYVHFHFAVMMVWKFSSDKLQKLLEYVPKSPATEFEDRAGLQWKDNSMTATYDGGGVLGH